MTLHPDILDGSHAEGARTVALAMVAEARQDAERLDDPADAEALHDFRVSVRRLRTTLRAWREPLGKAVRDRDLKRLRRVARATGEARNAQVLVAWVAGIAGTLPPAQRVAGPWLADRRADRCRSAGLSRTVERFRVAAGSIARHLREGKAPPSTGTFASALAGRIRDQGAALDRRLARVESDAGGPLAHRARIEGKRLRYLLEPVRGAPGVPSGRAVKALKRLQDLLGDLNDAELAAVALREARREAGRGAGLRPALLALELRSARRAGLLLARLRAEMLPTRGARIIEPALGVARALEARALRGGAAARARAAPRAR